MIRIIGISCIVGISGTIIIGTKICGPLGLKFGLDLWFFSLDIRFLGFGSVADSPCLDKRRIPNSHWWVLSLQTSTLPVMSCAKLHHFFECNMPKTQDLLENPSIPNMWRFPYMGDPQNGWFQMENPNLKWMITGGIVPHKAVAEGWLLWIMDGRANPLMDRKMVGASGHLSVHRSI